MKKVFGFIIFLFISSLTLSGQVALDKYFSDIIDKDEFTVVDVSKNMFKKMAKSMSSDTDEDLSDVIASIESMKTIKIEGVDGQNYLPSFSQTMLDNNFEELVSIQEKGERVKIYSDPLSEDKVKELVIMVSNKDMFYAMDMTGDLDLYQIAKLNSLPGMGYLKKE